MPRRARIERKRLQGSGDALGGGFGGNPHGAADGEQRHLVEITHKQSVAVFSAKGGQCFVEIRTDVLPLGIGRHFATHDGGLPFANFSPNLRPANIAGDVTRGVEEPTFYERSGFNLRRLLRQQKKDGLHHILGELAIAKLP
jgi:hypothetical protein